MFGVVGHCDGFVDQQDRNTVFDPIRTSQSRVVQKFVAHQKQWAAVFGADEDAEKSFVEHRPRQPSGMVMVPGPAGACTELPPGRTGTGPATGP